MVALSSDRHIAAARRRLVHLAGLSGKTQAAERAILTAALKRLGVVDGLLEKLRTRVLTDPGAAEQYQTLVDERGRLNLVIARARQAVAT